MKHSHTSWARIGLLGGTFDPVHLGHLLVAQIATEELNLDAMFFVPAFVSPFKTDRQPAPAELRLRMLRLALAGRAGWFVDDQELRRGGISYTIDTVREYARRYPAATLFYIVGADHAATIHQWREADQLRKLVRFAVVMRPGQEMLPENQSEFIPIRGVQISISSSEIRARVRAGKPIDFFVPAPVAEVIYNNRLYLDGAGG